MSACLLIDSVQLYLDMSVVFGLSICMARCNNSNVGNENDILGLLFGGWGCGEYSKKFGLRQLSLLFG